MVVVTVMDSEGLAPSQSHCDCLTVVWFEPNGITATWLEGTHRIDTPTVRGLVIGTTFDHNTLHMVSISNTTEGLIDTVVKRVRITRVGCKLHGTAGPLSGLHRLVALHNGRICTPYCTSSKRP